MTPRIGAPGPMATVDRPLGRTSRTNRRRARRRGRKDHPIRPRPVNSKAGLRCPSGQLQEFRAVTRAHYNGVRLHQGIGYVTPDDEHQGRGGTIRKASQAPRTPTMLANTRRKCVTKSETRHEPDGHVDAGPLQRSPRSTASRRRRNRRPTVQSPERGHHETALSQTPVDQPTRSKSCWPRLGRHRGH